MQPDDVRRLALGLPESTEQPHHAMASFRVGGKIFATLPPEGDRVHVMLDPDTARACAAAEPAVEELWWGRTLSGVRVPLATAGPDLVADLLELAWRRRAPARLVAELEAALAPALSVEAALDVPTPVDHHELQRFAAAVLAAVGTPQPEADFMAGVIVAADLAGHESHGMRRLAEYVARARDGHADPAARPVADLDTGSLVRLDGRHGWGHVVVRDATDLAVERARLHGIAAVGIHSSEAAGRYADFCERAAAQGIAVLFFVNDAGGGQSVAPPGGLQARLSTNPIAAGIPRAGSPHLVVDLSTSVVAAGRLAEERDRGVEPPPEWVTPTGAIRPVGGFKGFGLALVTEALAGALTGAGTVRAGDVPDDQGVFLIAIDVARMRPLGDFTAEVERFLGYVLDVPAEDGATPLRIPGAAGAAVAETRRRDGVPVQPHTWARMTTLATDFGLALPPTR